MNGFGQASLFWFFVFLFIVVALAFVSPPLLRRRARSGAADRGAVNVAIYRDQLRELAADLQRGELAEDQYRGAVLELEKRLSEDVPPRAADAVPPDSGRWAGFVLAAALPLLALGLYAMLGSPEAIAPVQAADESTRGGAAGAAQGEHDPSAMIAALEARLKDKPDDASGWYRLGRAYGALGRFDGAAGALAEASRLLPDDSRLLAEYAEALALAQGRRIDGKPLALLAKALEINDKEEKALELLGVAAYQNKNFAQAAFYWRQLLKAIPGDSDYARDIAAAAEEAEKSAARFSGQGDKAQSGARNVAADRMKRNTGQPAPAENGRRDVGVATDRVLP